MTVRKLVLGLVGMAAVLGGGRPAASGQEMTEQYIPIGQSPGVSGISTVIGTLQSVNAVAQTCAVAGATGTLNVAVTERTKIWLDRSKTGEPNLEGTFANLRPGVTVEVKPEDPQRGVGGPARWIKIQVPPSR
jgi:hypothetical protein